MVVFYIQVTLYHILKLFQNAPEIVVGKKPVVSEFYEEIVFQEPTALMQGLLTNVPQLTTPPVKHDADCKSLNSSFAFIKGPFDYNLLSIAVEQKKGQTMEAIINAKSKVKNELSELKDRLQLAKETIQKFRDEVQNLQLGNPPAQV